MNLGIFCFIITLSFMLFAPPKDYKYLLGLFAMVSSCSAIYYSNILSHVSSILLTLSYIGYLSGSYNKAYNVVKQSGYLLLMGLPFLTLDLFDKQKSTSDKGSLKNLIKYSLISAISLIVVLIFLFLYRQSNTTFDNWMEKIDLSFISINWLVTCLIGFVLLYGFFFPRPSKTDLDIPDLNALSEKIVSLRSLLFFAYLTIGALILLLSVFSVSEFVFLFEHHAADSLNSNRHSIAVHDSVETLIMSVVLVMAMTLIIFRSRALKLLPKLLEKMVITWLAFNMLVVLTSAYKNWNYVLQSGLTEKRIGVFFFLVLTTFGLWALMMKILRKQTNMAVYDITFLFTGILLTVSSMMPWHNWIARYNIDLALERNKKDILVYTIGLGPEAMACIVDRWTEIKSTFPNIVQHWALIEAETHYKHFSNSHWRELGLIDYLNQPDFARFLSKD